MNGTEVAVGTPTATDAQGDSLTYSVVGGDPSGLFYFDSQGTLMAAPGLDYESYTSHTLTIEVSDGYEVDTATVTVNVTDVVEPPTAPEFASNTFTYSVAENDGDEWNRSRCWDADCN